MTLWLQQGPQYLVSKIISPTLEGDCTIIWLQTASPHHCNTVPDTTHTIRKNTSSNSNTTCNNNNNNNNSNNNNNNNSNTSSSNRNSILDMNIKMCEHWSVWLYWWQDFLNLNYNPHQFLHSNPSIVWQSQQDLCWKIYELSHTVSKNDPYWVLWEQIDTWSEYQDLAIVVAHTGHPWATVNCAVEVFQKESRHAISKLQIDRNFFTSI